MAKAWRDQGRGRDSIRRTLLIYLGTLTLLGLALLFLFVRSYGRAAADRSYDQLLIASARSIADSVALTDGRWQVDLPYAALDVLAMMPEDRVFYRVSTSQNATITGYADLPRPRADPLEGRPKVFDAQYRGERTRFVVVSRWIAGPVAQGRVLVQVGQTRRAREALAGDMIVRALIAIALLSLAALVLAWVGVRRALRPLHQLERDLLRREPSDLRPVSGAVPLELDQLVGALNRFMARLSANNEALRAFMAEAAHQMRTPLAALRAQAQMALDENDPAEQRRSLSAIERNASRMSRLLNQLLSDASVMHRAQLQQFEVVDLAELVRQVLHEMLLPSGLRPNLRMATPNEPALLRGDALLLREAIKNLIDNAIKHGQSKSDNADHALQVAVAIARDDCILSVADHGPGIAPADAQTVFERFQRGHDAVASGAGLGLAIVKRIVESHRGRIDLRNRPSGGLEVTVHFPRLAV